MTPDGVNGHMGPGKAEVGEEISVIRAILKIQGGKDPREQNLPMGLIIRPRFWEINQTNEVQWSEMGATLAPQRKEMAHLKINVS